MAGRMRSEAEGFPIGEVARLTGVHVETIRYYERIRMLSSPPRTGGNRRAYGPDHIQALLFIRRSRELGFPLNDIRHLLSLVEGRRSCDEIKMAALSHLNDIRTKIADLRRMERTLAATAALCEGGVAPHCPIADALTK